MRFPKDFPDKLRSSILPSEVIGKKVKLKSRGGEFQGLCPFHNEKTPSFTVSDQKGFYHCFGCSAHGDIIKFTMETEGLQFPEAVGKLAEDFSIPIPQVEFKGSITEEKIAESKIDRDYLLLETAGKFFEKNLYDNANYEARNYLKTRNLNSLIAKKFRLGYAPDSYHALNNFLKSQNFSDAEILRSGIIGKNKNQDLYDKFRNRVIFPISDKKNRIIAFGGRTIGDDMPKYLNSAETEVFKKNQTLYNISLARKAIFKKGFAIVVEGYMDAIALAANGIENVVAGLGTALGLEHLKELFYITDKIVICLDGDQAGIRAAKRAAEIALPLINSKKNIAFTILADGMDPDDFIKEFGSKEMEKLFDNAVPLSESMFNFALMELKIDKNNRVSAEDKAKLERNLNEQLAKIVDPASKKYFSLFFKDLLFFLGKNGKKSAKSPNIRSFNNKIYQKQEVNFTDNIARNIIALMIKHPELAEFRDDDCDVHQLHFSSDLLTNLKENLLELIENGEKNQKNLLLALENSEISKDISEIENIITKLGDSELSINLVKFRILLLKYLLFQVDAQYKESLEKTDEIATHQSAIIDQKITEIFDYKNSLERKILALEQEII